jgi:hypothetical protein
MKFLPMKRVLLILCDDDEVYDREYYEKIFPTLTSEDIVNFNSNEQDREWWVVQRAQHTKMPMLYVQLLPDVTHSYCFKLSL